ncbi:S-adenosyl-L-methionine-dependent methyltransferase [Crucibulum laeve]|uniref:S-adenosyl-L-methionine-dependent methyltransferase n=1 Tax=Crucibulum laeve TaxID=68775 RepID=A0A5C3M4K4_9AGAR|nr:S-adenosyl-L-methionine-dependent methyltransferase [Crucibulum laeve]
MSTTSHVTALTSKENRRFTSFPGSSYVLPSDEMEYTRLTIQHLMWRRAFEGRLLYAPVTLKDGDEVLETGTGTGVWLLDLAKEYPGSVNLHGTDIEPNLFPKSHPENIHFSLASVTALSRDWDNKFNLVNQRFLVAALKKSEWPIALEELRRVLAPGGWLQLFEPAAREAGSTMARMQAITACLYELQGLTGYILTRQLPDMLKNLGFVNIRIEERSLPLGNWAGQEGLDGRKMMMLIYAAMKPAVLKSGGFGLVNSEEEYDHLLEILAKEMDSTPGTYIKACAIYAQKPE